MDGFNLKGVTDTWDFIPDFDRDQTEYWKVDPFSPEYEASTLGRIRDKNTKKLRTQYMNQCGYMACSVKHPDGRYRCPSVHTVILETFTEKSSCQGDLTCDHLDGNKFNNTLKNLEWVSLSENVKRANETGLSKYKPQPVLCVTDNKAFKSISEAARYYRVDSNDLTAAVRYGSHFKHLYFVKLDTL